MPGKFCSDFKCVQCGLVADPAQNSIENRAASFEIMIHD
jgi:hypothetical protein